MSANKIHRPGLEGQILLRSFCLLACLLWGEKSAAQPGCTDPQALNFSPAATQNDGSCTYPFTTYAPTQLALLPAALEECSGLAFFDNRLWTQEDGGSSSQIHLLNQQNGTITQTVTLPGSSNQDWEDLAEDDEHLYIGDFGNNGGNRTDLTIYKLKKSALPNGIPQPEIISFSFSDQTNFNHSYNAHDFDCEAFFCWNDSLHLFSKNWSDFKTRHYVLPATPGTHVAQLRDSLMVQGQITAADISDDGTALLLGYNVSTSETFIWLLFDFPDSYFFKGNKRKISLGSALLVSQPEGITFSQNRQGFICSERFSLLPQKLLSFDINPWVENPIAVREMTDATKWTVFPNPAGNTAELAITGPSSPFLRLELRDAAGRTVKGWVLDNFFGSARVSLVGVDLQPGTYYLTIEASRGKSVLKLLLQ